MEGLCASGWGGKGVKGGKRGTGATLPVSSSASDGQSSRREPEWEIEIISDFKLCLITHVI